MTPIPACAAAAHPMQIDQAPTQKRCGERWDASAPGALPLVSLSIVLTLSPACGPLGLASMFGDGESTTFRSKNEPHDSASDADAPADASAAPSQPPPKEPRVCVFDYDLTLSSHKCPATEANPDYFCRVNTCDTYGWYPQCLAISARAAIAECVRRHAYIGIASKATVDYCWADKVLPIISQQQFPELTDAPPDLDAAAPIAYPAIDVRSNWNCDDCAYTMDGALGKPEGIRRIMRHYGLNPRLAEDRARVIFWDDTAANVTDVEMQLPEVRAVLVPSFTGAGVDGGCGITQREIEAGWAP